MLKSLFFEQNYANAIARSKATKQSLFFANWLDLPQEQDKIQRHLSGVLLEI